MRGVEHMRKFWTFPCIGCDEYWIKILINECSHHEGEEKEMKNYSNSPHRYHPLNTVWRTDFLHLISHWPLQTFQYWWYNQLIWTLQIFSTILGTTAPSSGGMIQSYHMPSASSAARDVDGIQDLASADREWMTAGRQVSRTGPQRSHNHSYTYWFFSSHSKVFRAFQDILQSEF